MKNIASAIRTELRFKFAENVFGGRINHFGLERGVSYYVQNLGYTNCGAACCLHQ